MFEPKKNLHKIFDFQIGEHMVLNDCLGCVKRPGPSLSHEDRVRLLTLSVIFISTAGIAFLWGLVNLLPCIMDTEKDGHFDYWCISSVGTLTFTLVAIALTIFLHVSRMIEISLFLFNCTIFIVMDVIKFTADTGMVKGGHEIYVVFGCLTSVLVSKKFSIMIFWFLMWILNIFVTMPYNFFMNDMILHCHEIESVKAIAVSSFYSAHYIPSFVIFIAFFIFLYNLNKERKVVQKIAKEISQVEINSKTLKELKNKDAKKCSNMELLFKKILCSIEEMISFLPDKLKPSSYMSNGDNSKYESLTKSTNSIDSRYSMDEIQSHYSGSDTESENSFSSVNDIGALKKAMLKDFTFVQRNISYLMVDFKRMNKAIQMLRRSTNASMIKQEDFAKGFSKIFTKVYDIFEMYNGSCENLKGDKMICTFNTLKKCVLHAQQAVNCALKIHKVLSQMKFESYFQNIRYCIVVTTGSAFFGHIGSRNIRRFSLLSPIINRAHLLNNLKYGDGNSCEILVGENVRNAIKYEYEMIQIDKLLLKRKSERVLKENVNEEMESSFKVYRMISKRELNIDNEWIYHGIIENESKRKITKDLVEKKKNEIMKKCEMMWKYNDEGKNKKMKEIFTQVAKEMSSEEFGFKKDYLYFKNVLCL